MATSIDEAILEKRAGMCYPSSFESSSMVRQVLSEADEVSYRKLIYIIWVESAGGGKSGREAHKADIAKAFKSPLYSDAAKEYCAAANLSNELIFLPAHRFLTEKIILSYVENSGFDFFDMSYFTAVMESEHLSEQIMLAMIRKTDEDELDILLPLIPDRMITPEVITNWLAQVIWEIEKCGAAAAKRIKRMHPEYEGFPDDWVLKVFCGG